MKRKILIFGIVGAIIFLCTTSGCKVQERVRDVYHTDTVRITNVERIKEYVDTSRWSVREIRGDTVWLRDSVRIKWRYDSVVHDTVAAKETIVRTEVKREEVVKRSGYDKFCSWGFWVLVVVAIVTIIVLIVRWTAKYRMK